MARLPHPTGARRLYLFMALVAVILCAKPAMHHARAATLLASFSQPGAESHGAEELTTIDVPASPVSAARTVKARIYRPEGANEETPALVLVHGVQYLGIEEPRLQRFARSIAGAGIVVVTPQVDELADYHVTPAAIETVGATIRAVKAKTGHAKVGLIGTSFGGGVSLLTAADSRFADDVSFVVAIGAHDDLGRVSRFFATNVVEDVDGAKHDFKAHEYGATVLVYTHVEDFFPKEDVTAARDALRLWLWEKRDDARAAAKNLSPASKERVEKLFAADIASVRPELLHEIATHDAEMKRVSPHDRLAGIHANVYLLHGEGDSVIPASETLWLAHDVPANKLRAVLVSPAIQHVELKEPTAMDKWSLVHFMGRVIDEAEES